jgi:hypothetical protein
MLSSIFSLSPDYQFELEYEDVEIIERCSVATSGEPQLGIMLQEVWYALWKIPAMPKFVRFGADDSEMDKFGASCVSFWIQKGKIVYARFRR